MMTSQVLFLNNKNIKNHNVKKAYLKILEDFYTQSQVLNQWT